MILNPNVNVDTTYNQYVDKFTPDEGYALWRDNEEGNLDENGNPIYYHLQMMIQKRVSGEYAPHICAKLIDETMEVHGLPFNPPVETMTETEEKAAAYDILMGVSE